MAALKGRYTEDAVSGDEDEDPRSDGNESDFDYFEDRNRNGSDVDSGDEDLLAEMDADEIGRQAVMNLYREEEEVKRRNQTASAIPSTLCRTDFLGISYFRAILRPV